MNTFDWKRDTITGIVTVPRFTEKGYDLQSCDPASNFANGFMRRYKDRGVVNFMVFRNGNDHVDFHITLQAYYPDKGNNFTEAHWFHESNLEQVLRNEHRDYPSPTMWTA